ncbi:NDMA-dependent alcohol dehydrogenase [Pseudonocardia xishanensis]|uniref:NDMA-dependent alcohol dehydrogenase n=1 Tax=Pseudonocardia xishanensis TaxID=630995 RepID=A0ABP8RZ57_9PSEU
MYARAAVLRSQPGKWDIVDVDLEPPKSGEVLVRMAYAGLCHSDDHIATGDFTMPTPINGGHEGSGVVEAVGPDVVGLAVGDHVVTSFVPACGQCRWCASGQPNLCDAGMRFGTGAMADGTFRMFADGVPISRSGGLGTFATYNVFAQQSCIKVRADAPLDVACLVGCGVPTGWGSAVHALATQPGDTVIVMGIGGVGANALQGARHAGATDVIAVDLVASKRAKALEFGAHHFFTSMDEAIDLARSLTNGQGADGVVITTGVVDGTQIERAFAGIRKAGTVAVTAAGSMDTVGIPVRLFELSMYQKRIQGVLYGMGAPRREVQRLLDMYLRSQLKLDELITHRYTLEEINAGYADMRAGLNIRGIIDFETA